MLHINIHLAYSLYASIIIITNIYVTIIFGAHCCCLGI